MLFWLPIANGLKYFKYICWGRYSVKNLLALSQNSVQSARSEFRQVFISPASLCNSVSDAEEPPSADVCRQVFTTKKTKETHSPSAGDTVSTHGEFLVYIDELCWSGKLSDAIQFCRSLRKKQFDINVTAFNILLLAAARANDFILSSLIFKDLLSCHFPDSTSYSALAKSFLEVTEPKHIQRFGEDFAELTFRGGATVMNRIILGFAETGQPEKSLLIFEGMKDPYSKCKPDKITYNTVLAILGKSSDMQRMQSEFDSMKESGLLPDIITYNTLINCFRKNGRLDSCRILVEEMLERGIEPDLLTFTALIDGFGRLGQVKKALELFDELKNRGIQTSVYVYRSLISVLKKSGNLQMAEKLQEEMNSVEGRKLITSKNFRRRPGFGKR